MKHPLAPRGPMAAPVLARVPFSRAMLQNLLVAFEATSENCHLLLEVCPREVWAVTEDGARMCIGPDCSPTQQDV